MHHDLVGEDHVVGRERLRLLALARMPGHVLAQKEGIGAAVGRALPLLGQFGHDLLLLVDAHETVEDELGQPQRDHLVARDRVERCRPAVFAVAQRAAVRPVVLLGSGLGRNAPPAITTAIISRIITILFICILLKVRNSECGVKSTEHIPHSALATPHCFN